MSEYVIWDYAEIERACCLSDLNGYDHVYKLYDGESVLKEFPDDVTYEMDPDEPTGTLITDNIFNNLDLIVVSENIKTTVSDLSLPSGEIEFLPVHIMNHKGRQSKSPYFILHAPHPIDCLDTDACGSEWDVLDENAIETIQQIVFKPDVDFGDRAFFRAKYFSDILFVKKSVATELEKLGFSSLKFTELDQYIAD